MQSVAGGVQQDPGGNCLKSRWFFFKPIHLPGLCLQYRDLRGTCLTKCFINACQTRDEVDGFFRASSFPCSQFGQKGQSTAMLSGWFFVI